ncbi:hypothetical protein [Mesobacillus sp.]|uniref:hypothetical protein n=1 Tax=Mesobacillus sp. TaxID=2675271 RepID=UPI0039F0F07E
MSKQRLTIVPVTIHSENKGTFNASSSTTTSNSACTIKTANVEISFFNSVDEQNIQTVMKELKNL